VLERLARIDALERRLLAEIAALAREAERWAALDGDARARAVAADLRARFPNM